ncbi:MAG: D-tyrosyl-tRNA(Tyr) deacylase [Gammaproteobacteria bacterium]|nr:D-tyrosyl-tRNA(Tyr) deacylase [Gammaproteobacteria bacterium]
MIVLLQRVKQASVEINGQTVGQINQGLLVFAGFEPQDDEDKVSHLLERLLNYRMFADQDDKMNLSVRDIQGGLLLVPQFTLAADTGRGRRPSFTTAASPDKGLMLFDFMCDQAAKKHEVVSSGRFGADMQVHLQNDGPVTFLLRN